MTDPALCKKLGCKPGSVLLLIDCPAAVASRLPEGEAADQPTLILAFVRDKAALSATAPGAIAAYRRGAALWFAYPKKSGSIVSDMSRDDGWDSLSALDLLPVTQIAIDSDWSALRFRYRDEIARLTRASDFPGKAARGD
ncbi:MAG: hypothetical protein Q27BB25_06105 [Blastomonas sp. CACIA14H2]|uniref:hypothetical protein n=1 Tax=unclassified Blastomonas TaxID=2626550 RepID=UPI0003D01128|nr:hypothetical protein [Blastomonas sp. UPD001]ESZ88067.1 MAG: hypothetical protein Q27BB25_06105 [Blastomonas sp. CACIA14H2]MBL0965552.1 hypothetical protein [Blastomonas sp.]